MSTPLSGIRVIELSTFVAGPVTARLLADLGAEVIKIESLDGDGWRLTGTNLLPHFTEDENPIFDIYNIGKKHISLNLKTPEGKEVFLRLLSTADVFVTNLRPEALKRLGLAYEDLKDKFPKLVYAAILGYGSKGPDAHKQAYDTTAFWSRGGFLRDMAVDGKDYFPVNPPTSIGDTATGYLLMGEICAALFRRTTTGTGDYVTSTLYHNSIFCMGTMVMMAQPPFGRNFPYTRVDSGSCEGCYKCLDGEWIYFAVGNTVRNLPKYHAIIGHPELDNDPRFQRANLWDNRKEYYEYFRNAFLTKTADEWVAIADEYDVPLVRLAHFSDISTDPQAWEAGFIEHIHYPNGNVDVMPTSPIEMNSAVPREIKPAPKNGADTFKVLTSIGYSKEEIIEMQKSKAIKLAEDVTL